MKAEIVKVTKLDDGEFDVQIKNARVSFPHIWTPDPNPLHDSQKDKTSCSFILNKECFDKLSKVATKVVQAVDDNVDEFSDIGSNYRKMKKRKTDEGTEYLASTSNNPGWETKYLDNNGKVVNEVTDEIERRFYAGCYANIKIRYKAGMYNNQGLVYASLVAIQFAGNGEKLGGVAISDDDVESGFGVVEIEDDFDDTTFDNDDSSDDEFDLDDMD